MKVADKTTLRARLKDLGGEWLANKMTPRLAEYSGVELEPEGANLVVHTALIDICEGLPVPAATSVMMQRDKIVAKMFVD